MTDAEPLFNDAPPPARKAKSDPATIVVCGNWFYPVTLLVPVIVFVPGYWLATESPLAMLAFALVGTLTGLVMTMIAMAWGAAVAFMDGARAGLLFTIFPPYMPYFAATRWRWMAQPTVLFLAGLTLAVATLWTVKLMTPPASTSYAPEETSFGLSAVTSRQIHPCTVV